MAWTPAGRISGSIFERFWKLCSSFRGLRYLAGTQPKKLSATIRGAICGRQSTGSLASAGPDWRWTARVAGPEFPRLCPGFKPGIFLGFFPPGVRLLPLPSEKDEVL